MFAAGRAMLGDEDSCSVRGRDRSVWGNTGYLYKHCTCAGYIVQYQGCSFKGLRKDQAGTKQVFLQRAKSIEKSLCPISSLGAWCFYYIVLLY